MCDNGRCDNRKAATKNNRLRSVGHRPAYRRSRIRYLKVGPWLAWRHCRCKRDGWLASPSLPWYANSPTSILPKNEAARRCGRRTHVDALKRLPFVTSRHVVDVCVLARASHRIVHRWVLLFLDISSRLRANQSHGVCANGLQTPNGFSSPQPVSLRCSVLLLLSHDDSAATSPIHGPSATPAKGTSRTTATPATPAVFGAAVARHRHHVWSHSYPVAPRTPPSLRHTTLEIPSADFPITSPPARSKRATIAKQMLAY